MRKNQIKQEEIRYLKVTFVAIFLNAMEGYFYAGAQFAWAMIFYSSLVIFLIVNKQILPKIIFRKRLILGWILLLFPAIILLTTLI